MPPHTPARLVADLRALGVHAGQTVMLHTSVNAVGQVMGGANTILQALFEVLTPNGTLMMYAGWQDIPDFLDELDEDERALYRAQHPPFDPAHSRAVRDNSILAEFLRTWRGTQRSLNPEASMVANGAQADYLTRDHPLNYGYGTGSPLEKLVQLGGHVLMLGAPLDTVTLLHYSEFVARLRHKNVVHYSCPMIKDGATVWVEVEDYDTGDHHDNYAFRDISQAYVETGRSKQGKVGDADCTLFDAADLNAFAVKWLEERFGK
jgi:aminoglycoside 3-N-acetyltransferase